MTPGYWIHETGGELRPAIVAYIQHRPLTQRQIYVIKAYLTQWINAPGLSVTLGALQRNAAAIETLQDIDDWLSTALDEGIDPL